MFLVVLITITQQTSPQQTGDMLRFALLAKRPCRGVTKQKPVGLSTYSKKLQTF